MTELTAIHTNTTQRQNSTPRDGCPRCGGVVTPTTEPLEGRPATDCEHCGIVEIGRAIATDGGTDTDECETCEQLDDDLPCFNCFRRAR